MVRRIIPLAAGIALGLATLNAAPAAEPSLKERILAVDKELAVMRKNAQSDPEVKTARAQLQVALDKLNATVDAVVVRNNPKGKELLDRRKKLIEEYRAQQKATDKNDGARAAATTP